MSGTILSHGVLRSCRKCFIQKFPVSCTSKMISSRLHVSANRTLYLKSWHSVSRQTGQISRNLILNQERSISVTSTNRGWFPWGGNTEPPAIPKDIPPTPAAIPPPDSVSTTNIVSDSVQSTAVDAAAAADPGLLNVVNGMIVDPPFTELGLATKWFPNHFVHELLEFVHLNTGLEWWSTIIIGTVAIRLLTMPLFILSRKITINTQNHADEIKKGHEKLERYKYSEESMRLLLARKEMKDIYKRTGTGPIRTVAAAPSMSIIFITCVMALRQMAAVPVPSFLEGGILWFTDLSMPDPYFALPIITGGVMGLYIHTLVKGGSMPTKYVGIIRKVKYLPVILVPLVLGKTSSAVFLYWLTTSIFSLTFVRLLAIPGVKEMLKFPEMKRAKVDNLLKGKGLFDTIKNWRTDSYDKTHRRMQYKEVQRERKRIAKEQKKILKGDPPVTYEIGVDALPSSVEVADFQREWRPNKPKHFGHY